MRLIDKVLKRGKYINMEKNLNWHHLVDLTSPSLSIKFILYLRYQMIYLGLLMVGIGSWMFHMTLKYEMQLLDELPMVWGG